MQQNAAERSRTEQNGAEIRTMSGTKQDGAERSKEEMDRVNKSRKKRKRAARNGVDRNSAE
jgi:hypothetical protein